MKKLVFAVALVLAAPLMAKAACKKTLLTSKAHQEEIARNLKYQAEIQNAWISYAASFKDILEWHPSLFSQNRSYEGRFLVTNGHQGTHAISLGSGPDVFRLVYDFPTSSHYHYVDYLIGWGERVQVPVAEFVARVKAIARGANVRVISRGFLEDVSYDALVESHGSSPSKSAFAKRLAEKPFLEPLILEAAWHSPTLGRKGARFYLHPVDYNSNAQVNAFLKRIPVHQDLGGVLLTGAIAPPTKTFRKILMRLSSRGALFMEADFEQKRFTTPIKLLSKDFDFLPFPDPVGKVQGHGDWQSFVVTRKR